MYDLYDLAHAAGWEACDLHDLAHVSSTGHVLTRYGSSTTDHNGRYGIYRR